MSNSSATPPAKIMTGSPPDRVVPRMDWDRPPWNRWSFQHIRELVPTVEVWRGNGHRSKLPRAERDLDDLPVSDPAGRTSTLRSVFEDALFCDGMIVLKDDAVAYERYFNGMSERTLHLSQSVAKSVAGAVAGILVGRGLLDPAAPVTTYLPELDATAWRGATLRQVLDMTTGVKFSEEYTDPYSEIGQVDVATGWKPVPPGSDPAFVWPAHVWELITRLKATTREHGARFEYRSIETDVLAFCMERATGKRLAQIVSDELWQKLGAEESACYTVDPAGYALADGGFNATLRDYARFGQLILEGGRGIVPEGWIEATRSGVHSRNFSLSLPRGSYRNQFWIEDPTSRNLMCRGVFGQLIWMSWEHRTVVVVLSSWPEFLNHVYGRTTLAAVHKIAEALA